MSDKYFVYFLISMAFLFLLFFCGEILSQKIRADLLVDMAERGYFQKEVDGKLLWIKDEK